MFLRRTLLIMCLVVSVLCLSAGFGIAGRWIGAVTSILVGPCWLLTRKYPASKLQHICLLVTVGLAVAGKLVDAPAVLMIVGSALALASWDLILFDAVQVKDPTSEQTRRYENEHLRSLTLAIGAGVIVTLLGRLIRFQIPFIVLLLCVLLILIALDRVWGMIKRTGKR